MLHIHLYQIRYNFLSVFKILSEHKRRNILIESVRVKSGVDDVVG